MPDYIPKREAELLPFGRNFAIKLTAAPMAYGLSEADAEALMGQVDAFEAALAEALDPATRTRPKVATKNEVKRALIHLLRSLAQRIKFHPAVTAEQKLELGLPGVDGRRTRVAVPSSKPVLVLLGNSGRIHRVRLIDEATPSSRARPKVAAGAEVYSFLAARGQVPPSDLTKWRHHGQSTTGRMDLVHEDADVGLIAHIRALWFNRRGEGGPVSEEITAMVVP